MNNADLPSSGIMVAYYGSASYYKHCGDNAEQCAKEDLLGSLLDLARIVSHEKCTEVCGALRAVNRDCKHDQAKWLLAKLPQPAQQP